MWTNPWPQPTKIRVPISSTWMTSSEKLNIQEALDANWIGSNGFFNAQAETQLSNLIGADSLLVANGSVALTLGLKALGIQPGDEVIVPALTYAATASSVVNAGAIPVFIDAEEQTWGISLDNFERAISEKTKCLIIVFLYGTPFDFSAIAKFAKEKNISIIADCAESFLATQDSQQIGLIGADICTFSFFSNKLITCGEGGAVSSSNPELVSKMKLLRGQGMDPTRRYFFQEAGFNFRMSNLHAAILSAQIKRFPEIHNQRKEIEDFYYERFCIEGIDFQRPEPRGENMKRSPWLFTVRFPHKSMEKKIKIAAELASNGIETRPVFYPLPEMDAFSNFRYHEGATSRKIATEGMSFPTGFHVDETVVAQIVEIIRANTND